jgi:hypothetical protein
VAGMTGFVPGLELCRGFYEEVVAPAVAARHGAALLGSGSDILGYDAERSTDHDWARDGSCLSKPRTSTRCVLEFSPRFRRLTGEDS